VFAKARFDKTALPDKFHGDDKMETPTIAAADAANGSATTELLVEGMTCQNCARHVTEAIQSAPGVRSASVSLEKKSASVRWNLESSKDIAAVISAVQQAGYEAKLIQAGKTKSSPAKHADWQITLWLGLAVTAALMIGEWIFRLAMTPWFQWLAFGLAGVVQIFCGAQFYRGAWRQLKAGSSNMDTLVALGSTTAFGFSCWVLFSGAGGHVYFMEAAAIISLISAGHWIEARVSTKAGGALKSLLNLAPQTARRISFTRQESGPLIPAFSPGGGEGVRRTDEGAFNLKTLDFSKSAIGNRKSEIEQEVPVSELKIGDRIALRPGDRVPVDGVVLAGDSAVDEAMLTGESVPVDKKSGSELFAGTVNLNGRLVMRVAATGEATALAHIIAAVQRAQTSRADIQRLGDRISNVFVPIVVTIAVAAGLWWGLAPASAQQVHDWLAQIFWHTHAPAGVAAGFIVAAAVLIVACPCAMGLATPAAIMASANTAARRGILIRDGVALEKAGKITSVIFDKTGTLTLGKPEVVALGALVSDPACFESIPVHAGPEAGAPARLAAALARHSTHPISQAIAKISAEKIEVSDWKEIRGCGVEAKLPEVSSLAPPRRGEGRGEGFVTPEPLAPSPQPPPPLGEEREQTAHLGSLNWLKESGVNLAAGEKFISEWSQQGATIVGLASDKTLLGLFAVRDAVKPNAKQVVEQLQQQGLKIYLLTGDNALTAASIARQVGIAPENVFAEVRPEQKAEFVKKLQAGSGTGVPPVRTGTHGRDARATMRVAFVGDGINDAPALTQADLGIAVSRASDVAREAADIILLKSEIEAVPEALGLARATLRTIKQNLFWAFFYNALGVPLAAMGFISPIFCAAAMGVSDLVVIGNALRLLRWRK
jgi:P-type Cu+ transporter